MRVARQSHTGTLCIVSVAVLLMVSCVICSAAAVEAEQSAPPSPPSCATLHYREQCTLPNCIWCANKWSPWSGSDGVCIEPEGAKTLPDWSYTCSRVKPGEGAAGGRMQEGWGGRRGGIREPVSTMALA